MTDRAAQLLEEQRPQVELQQGKGCRHSDEDHLPELRVSARVLERRTLWMKRIEAAQYVVYMIENVGEQIP